MSTLYLHFLTFSLFIYFAFAQISDKRLCVDLECKSPVSEARTLSKYFSPDNYRLSFEPSQDIIIYSKSAGSDESLWGAEINGKRGYVPKYLVRETRKIAKPLILVDTEITNIPNKPEVPLKEEIVNPSKVKQNFEVIDGTTIYINAGGEDVAGNQDSAGETPTQPSDSAKIDSTIENDHSTEKVNVSTDIPNSEDLKVLIEPKVVDSTAAESIVESENSHDKLEEHKVATESALKSSDDLNNIQDVAENASQNQIIQSIDIQYKKEIENSDINMITKDIGDQDSNTKENNESSENKLQDQEIITNPFSFVSNAIKDVLGSGIDLDQGITQEKFDTNKVEDEKFDSAKLDIFNLEDNKSEPQKQVIHADILSINQESNTSFNEGNYHNEEVHNSQPPKTGQNLVVGDIQNSLYSISENLPIKNSSTVDKTASQQSEDSSSQPLQINTGKENVVEKIVSDVQNNSPLITEKLISSESVNSENIPNDQSLNIKEESENVVSTVESNVASISENSSIKNENVLSPLITEKVTSSESVTSENDINNDQSLKINMKNQNVVDTVEGAVSSIIGNSSVEVNSDPEEMPQVIENAPSDNREDVNIVPSPGDVDKNSELANNEAASSQNEELVRTREVNDGYQPTQSISYYDNNVFMEHNNIQENNTPSYNSIDTQELSNVGVDSAESLSNREQLQNVHVSDPQAESSEHNENIEEEPHEENFVKETPNIFSYLNHDEERKHLYNEKVQEPLVADNLIDTNKNEEFSENVHEAEFCTKQDCPNQINSKSSEDFTLSMDLLNFSSDIFIYLVTTAVSVIIFLLGHFALDKSRREGPLLFKINRLEKEYLILLKEKEILVEQVENKKEEEEHVDSEEFLNLQQEKEMLEEKVQNLEENVQTLEKELENSTEVGLELNRMLSEVLNSENAGQTLMLNIEGLQAQLAEQQGIVSSMKEVLNLKETENHELNLELDIANKKVFDLQSELDKLLSNIIKLEEDKETLEKNTESQIIQLKSTVSSLKQQLESHQKEYMKKIEQINNDLSTSEHNLQVKTKEFEGLKSSMQQIKEIKNANTLESLFEVNSIRAELEQLKTECQGHCDRLRMEKETNSVLEKKVMSTEEQIDVMKTKFDETDKTRLELETKLQVLTNYFKEKEEQLQKELSKYESMWSAKQGEATSTSEKIKYLQSEVQNYKAQNETLKQEIVSQEVELKGQISVLEKKVHENWVSARQAERRLEELKQEAAQLRNRLTLRERALQDDRLNNRMQSPLEQSGEIPISPLHLESPASPPLLYNSRDHITKSPPILGMPPPFLPPPTGSSYLPPPPPTGGSYLPPPPLPFMPPPPHDMFPGDHRPPPLGRMSSPPLNSRYSPSRPYSPYDRSPSPSYDESEYGTSPVHRRNYSQFNRRRDHRPAAMEKFNGRSGTLSSGSENSNESLDEINHQNSKV